MTDIYRLAYTSRNLLRGAADEQERIVSQIIEDSQRNNVRAGITGALLFSEGNFVQVLEGSRVAVEATFERIQRDRRHGDVSVLQCEAVGARIFSDWSMAFVGCSTRGRALWDGLAQSADFELACVESDLLCRALLAILRAEQSAEALPPKPRTSGLDIERLRSALEAEQPHLRRVGPVEIKAARPVLPPPSLPRPAAPARSASIPSQEVQGDVLRAALNAERERTMALRGELDEVHIELAQSQGEVEALGRQRDIWSDRSSQLRTNLKKIREDLRAAEAERDELRSRVAAYDRDLDTLRVQRDIWSERARALATAFCSDPVVDRQDSARVDVIRPVADRERPSLVKVAS